MIESKPSYDSILDLRQELLTGEIAVGPILQQRRLRHWPIRLRRQLHSLE